jgi:hypothetical protein
MSSKKEQSRCSRRRLERLPFYQRDDVRIRYEEIGSGYPLLVIPAGGLNWRVSNWQTAVFNAMEEFKRSSTTSAASPWTIPLRYAHRWAFMSCAACTSLEVGDVQPGR